MTEWWLLHAVGDADLGVVSNRDNSARDAHRQQRQQAMGELTDPAELADRLVGLSWDGPTTGRLSPLAAVTRALPPSDPVRLVLVATPVTGPIADALVAALSRAPGAFDRELEVTVVRGRGSGASGGLSEDEVTTALAPYLREVPPDVRVLITWGSGSTQVAFGLVEAAIHARLRWAFANVGTPLPPDRYMLLDPGADLGVDPLLPLVRRWRYHDLLRQLIASKKVTVSDELRRELSDAEQRWRRAHLDPTVEDLRVLMIDALMRGDATSCFAVRAYVLAYYRWLREREDPSPCDLVAWAERTLHHAQLGRLCQLVRQERRDRDVVDSKNSASGRWLLSETVKVLNEAGIRGSHYLAPPPATLRRSLRVHLVDVSAVQPARSDAAALMAALGAWYVTVVGEGATREGTPRHPLQEAAETGAESEVARYLGARDPTDVDRRYLVLGTGRSAADAAELVRRINAVGAGATGGAVAGTVPDPATRPLTPDAAYTLLREHFEQVRTEIGAVVLVPTGLKSLVLPLLMAGLRLAAEEGIPLFLRQLTGGAMHLLPVHFGADAQLLGLARHALDILELDVAVRLLRHCSAGRELADRADRLRRALRCEGPEQAANWPAELPRDWTRTQRSTGLAAQRVETWADLAARRPEPVHEVRAVMGAQAVLEQSIRNAHPDGKNAKSAWDLFTRQSRLAARSGKPHAKALPTLVWLRNELPISHGNGAVHQLDALIGRKLGSPRPVTVADLLRLASHALRRQLGERRTGAPRLSAVFDQLRADVSRAQDVELDRLERAQAATSRTKADIVDLLGRAAIEAVEAPELSDDNS